MMYFVKDKDIFYILENQFFGFFLVNDVVIGIIAQKFCKIVGYGITVIVMLLYITTIIIQYRLL